MDTTTILIGLVALLVGLSKGGLGGPVPVSMTAPILSLVMPVSQAVGITLPFLLIADLFALRVYWRDWDIKFVRLMLPLGILGVFMGATVLASLPDDVLRRILGGFTLLAVIYKVASDSLTMLTYTPRKWHGFVAGWASGFGSALANVGAPPFTAYLLLQKVSPLIFIGTTTLFFAIINALKLPFFLRDGIINPQLVIGTAWAVPIIPFGVWLGRKTIEWINPRLFEGLMLGLLFMMSLYLILASQ